MTVALGASTALAVTIGVGAVGGLALLVQRRSQPPPRPEGHGRGQGTALRIRGMPVLFVVMVLLGSLFAGVEVTVIATAREAGETGTAGVVLSVWALSSLIAGLTLGSLHRAPPLPVQLQLGTLGLAVTLVPLLFTNNLTFVAVVLFVAGFGVSPSLIAGFALVEQLVPSARLTEGLTWVTTGLSLGFALGSPVTGIVVDTAGPAAGFWVGLAAAVAATSTVFAARGSWGPQPAPA